MFSRAGKDGTPRPGDLFAKDVYPMKLSADLVVLRFCKSAIGKQQLGEGPMSLSHAFLFAGAKSVVASLWEVNDDATGELMQQFYWYMRQKKSRPQPPWLSPNGTFANPPTKNQSFLLGGT